jgi:hypothetical protein
MEKKNIDRRQDRVVMLKGEAESGSAFLVF